jgi:myo-inositol catabolism protein IolC
MLAFDHRSFFQKQLFGMSGTLTAEDHARIADTKALIFEGFMDARSRQGLSDEAGILVDEEFGAPIARRAKELGIVLAMPAESSGRAEFDFEYGDQFARHIEDFDPTFTKVLVRYNPESDRSMNQRQTIRLRALADWLHERERKFLLELLVPAGAEHMAAVDEDLGRYDREIRPRLTVQAIAELQHAGVEADVWKIEGLESRGDCARIAQQARYGGRDGVRCIVLGRGANMQHVENWLKAAAAVEGYAGFAIGRTIWWEALEGFGAGLLGRADAVRQISGNYLRAVDAYLSAER